jgi:beta-galactosidase
MLDHQARPDFTYDETVQVFDELTRLTPIIDATRFITSAALLQSEDIDWAYNHAIGGGRMGRPVDIPHLFAQGRILRWYSALYHAKVTVDVLEPTRALDKYKAVFVPNLYLINPEIVANLKSHVQNGGFLLVGPKAGLKNWDNVFLTDIPPGGGLSELFGVEVKPGIRPLRFGGKPVTSITMAADAPFAAGMRFANEGLSDPLESTGARVLAYNDSGDAAITLNSYGEGQALYMGCEPEEACYRYMIEWLATEGRVAPILRTDADVEVTLREGGGHRLIFVLNHNNEPEQIVLEKPYHELITDRPVSGVLVLQGQSVAILHEDMA